MNIFLSTLSFYHTKKTHPNNTFAYHFTGLYDTVFTFRGEK
jgi:hypothetical protein